MAFTQTLSLIKTPKIPTYIPRTYHLILTEIEFILSQFWIKQKRWKKKSIVKIIPPPYFETLLLCKKILTIRCRDDTFIIFDAAKRTNQPTNQQTNQPTDHFTFYISTFSILGWLHTILKQKRNGLQLCGEVCDNFQFLGTTHDCWHPHN